MSQLEQLNKRYWYVCQDYTEYKYPHQPKRFPEIMMCLPEIRCIAGETNLRSENRESRLSTLFRCSHFNENLYFSTLRWRTFTPVSYQRCKLQLCFIPNPKSALFNWNIRKKLFSFIAVVKKV